MNSASPSRAPAGAHTNGRFRKLPVEVEAWQVASGMPCPRWLSDAMMRGSVRAHEHRTDCLQIDTLEGTMTANPGDWIIRGVLGELYPCDPSAFWRTYEPVE